MKNVYTTLGFALGASAALIPRDQCCFSLTAAGGKTGTVGQLSDGQNRIGQTGGLANQQGTYCLSNGGLTDGSGRGCILTPPTTQFQCDAGASPTTGFAVNSNGDLTYNGNTQFYACATGDNGGYNIYTTTNGDQTGCVKVTLNTGGKCNGNGGSSSSSASASSAALTSQPASSTPPASSAPSASSAPLASSAPSAPSAPPASSVPPATQPATGSASQGTPTSQSLVSQPTAGPQTQTVYSTYYQTITSCGADVTNCPAESTVVKSNSVPVAPSATTSASQPTKSSAASQPASSQPASSQPASSQPASSQPASSQSASSQPTGSQPASSAPAPSGTSGGNGGNGNACPTTLGGAYQTPHAIIPVNKDQPSTSYGTQYNAYISSSNSTIFNFDIPQSYSGKQCSVIFLLPKKADLQTSDFTLTGSGGIKFDQLTSAAPLSVTYATCPAVKNTLGSVDNVTPGNSYVVSTGSCQAGSTISIEASSTGGLDLTLFEDWNPSPIGLFITTC